MAPAPRSSRRRLLALAGLAGLAACADDGRPGRPPVSPRGSTGNVGLGRLEHRPGLPRTPATPGRTGTFALPVEGSRPAVLHVPDVAGPLRLVVLLHGAGGEPSRTVEVLRSRAQEHRLLLVCPPSRAATWDVLTGGFGPDVRAVDALLDRATEAYPVAARTIAGFSDGASYALTLGLTNGDVFDSVVAFSPGFEAAQVRHGRPRVFVSHGTGDRVLPIDRCSRRLVPALERAGYDVTYREFDGGHEVPPDVRRAATAWLTDG